ncbi:alpha/beta fold hydrolase [Mucilaginibacter sp. KACC 22063]|uniref:alpha/beta fold hydrolase n=1 Tax=Mucilaginibacter sp. KACC 22063 TaxID=3025666 RepID=UPI00236564AD|nr:alpha/beta hydrolase [Mucilaginibacter sp. KACC 22063]WDF55217.1 alpha/beta hydrolase [Mucilaginibacter sp. KACC 22063]
MKRMRGIVKNIKEATAETDIKPLLWELICYSPKMPLWLPQKELLADAAKSSLMVKDQYFSGGQLNVNIFTWGTGSKKIVLTHGWSSKALDFVDLINALRNLPDVQIIAFDAPGNGSSEGDLSNLLLYVEALKAIFAEYGAPDVLIGHSLGVMANVMAINDSGVLPGKLISLTPLVKLKENFIATMDGIGIDKAVQEEFFQQFRVKFSNRFSYFNLTTLYKYNNELPHYLIYDEDDAIAPFSYLKEFIAAHPSVEAVPYNGAGHERVLKNEQAIADILEQVQARLQPAE